MNRFFVYIISTMDSIGLHVGYCKDIRKMIKFYQMPSLVYSPTEFNQLVYVEFADNKDEAHKRFVTISAMPREEKEKIIEVQNPDWVQIIPGENMDI